ncbi:MAG: hypothetical protein CM1200mP22_01320 [Dehalococcoidia bacterium]|nr:MAG: hypothetical protein CM1200mP22_01320 [Dehalococcoidia bacterium]
MTVAARMNNLGTESAFEVLARARALEAQGRDIIHLEIGEPDFETPQHIVEAGIKGPYPTVSLITAQRLGCPSYASP